MQRNEFSRRTLLTAASGAVRTRAAFIQRALQSCAIATMMILTPTHAARWEKLPPLPEPHGGFICGALGEKIVVLGGTNWKDGTKRWLDAIWTFEPRTNGSHTAHGRTRWRMR